MLGDSRYSIFLLGPQAKFMVRQWLQGYEIEER